MPQLKLTKRVVDDAQPGEDGKQALYWDSQLAGFGLLVGRTSKTYVCQRRVNGRTVRTTIGRHGILTTDEARAHARQLLAQMALGANPTEEKRKAAARGVTLEQAWGIYRDTLKAKGSSAKTTIGYEQALSYLKPWFNRPLAEIGREEVRARHKAIAAEVRSGKRASKYHVNHKRGEGSGRDSANRTMRVLRAVWNRARRAHPELPENPVQNVDWYKIEKPRTNLTPEQLPIWYKAVRADKNAIRRDLMLLLLFSGLRRGDGQKIEWKHVNFEQRVLHLPNPKGGKEKAFDLPLSDFLVQLLKQRRAGNEQEFPDSPYAFPSLSNAGYVADPRIEIEGIDWSPHDLRRTFLTEANKTKGLSVYDLKTLVNHRQPSNDTTSGYLRIELEQLRAPMQAITDRLLALCQGGGEVVPMRGRKVT